jgi:hypothetical protein
MVAYLKGTNQTESEIAAFAEYSAPSLLLHCGPAIRGSVQFDISWVVKQNVENCTVYIHTDTNVRHQCKSAVSGGSVTCLSGCHVREMEAACQNGKAVAIAK